MKALVERDNVKQISETDFIMHTRKSHEGVTICKNRSVRSQTYTLSLLQMLSLKYGCFHESESYLVISPYQFKSNKTFQEYTAPHEITNTFIGEASDNEAVVIERENEYQKALDKVNDWAIALLNGQRLDDRDETLGVTMGNFFSGLPNLGISLGSILVLIMLGGLITYCLKSKLSNAQTDMSRAKMLAVRACSGNIVMEEAMIDAGLMPLDRKKRSKINKSVLMTESKISTFPQSAPLEFPEEDIKDVDLDLDVEMGLDRYSSLKRSASARYFDNKHL